MNLERVKELLSLSKISDFLHLNSLICLPTKSNSWICVQDHHIPADWIGGATSSQRDRLPVAADCERSHESCQAGCDSQHRRFG